jgi:hypothetical protein
MYQVQDKQNNYKNCHANPVEEGRNALGSVVFDFECTREMDQ